MYERAPEALKHLQAAFISLMGQQGKTEENKVSSRKLSPRPPLLPVFKEMRKTSRSGWVEIRISIFNITEVPAYNDMEILSWIYPSTSN